MGDWSGDSDSGKGGGYDFQWVAAAVLAINYLKLPEPAPLLPGQVHRSIGRVQAVGLELIDDGDQPRQDVTLEGDGFYIQVQIKRNKNSWQPSELRSILEHLRDHRRSRNDLLVFSSDRDLHNNFNYLRSGSRSEAEMELLLGEVTKKHRNRNVKQSDSKQKILLSQDDVRQMHFKLLGDQSEMESRLELMLSTFMPVHKETLDVVVSQFKRWSTKVRGTVLTLSLLNDFLAKKLTTNFPADDWLIEPRNREIYKNLSAIRRQKKPTWVVDPHLALETLGCVLVRPRSVLTSEDARLGLILSQFAASFPERDDWAEKVLGLGVDQDLATKSHDLAHNAETSSGFASATSAAAWPGRELASLFRSGQRMNWHRLGLFGTQPTTSDPFVRGLHWRCAFLQDIRFDHIARRRVSVVLAFPPELSLDRQAEVRERWRSELARDFDEAGQSISVETLAGQWPGGTEGVSPEMLDDLGLMLKSMPTQSTKSKTRETAFQEKRISAGNLPPFEDTPEGWEARARAFKSNDSLAQALSCWEKATERNFGAGEQVKGFAAFVSSVELIREGCWAPAFARLPSTANLKVLAASDATEVYVRVLQALAWAALGELNLNKSRQLLETALAVGQNCWTPSITLQLARVDILAQRPEAAVKILEKFTASVDDLGDHASQFLQLASELYSESLTEAVVSKSKSAASTARFRLTLKGGAGSLRLQARSICSYKTSQLSQTYWRWPTQTRTFLAGRATICAFGKTTRVRESTCSEHVRVPPGLGWSGRRGVLRETIRVRPFSTFFLAWMSA